jgi:hypothetical protein
MSAKAASHGVSATSQTRSSGSSLDVGASAARRAFSLTVSVTWCDPAVGWSGRRQARRQRTGLLPAFRMRVLAGRAIGVEEVPPVASDIAEYRDAAVGLCTWCQENRTPAEADAAGTGPWAIRGYDSRGLDHFEGLSYCPLSCGPRPCPARVGADWTLIAAERRADEDAGLDGVIASRWCSR